MCPPFFYYWAIFISLPQLPGCSSMASGQRREQIRESHQHNPPNFAQLFLPVTIIWRAWHLLLSVIYFMIFAYFIVRVNQRRRPHKQRLLIVTFLFFIRFSFKLMQIIFDSGLQFEYYSGTPWLLDVLNGFIAHNNVSNLRLLFLVSSCLSLWSSKLQHHLFFFIFDLINAFNGLFIFLLFIAKKEVMMGLRQLLRRGRDQNGVRAMFSATSHVALTLSSSISTNVSSPAASIEQ